MASMVVTLSQAERAVQDATTQGATVTQASLTTTTSWFCFFNLTYPSCPCIAGTGTRIPAQRHGTSCRSTLAAVCDLPNSCLDDAVRVERMEGDGVGQGV